MSAFVDALLLRGGHNTLVVVVGTALLGISGGLVGSFTLLRKRSLFADALGHATLPGVCVAFLLAPMVGVATRSLPWLLAGAAVGAVAAAILVQSLARSRRFGGDVAIGATLATLFALGIVLLSIIQTLPGGDQGGLSRLLLGQTAALSRGDAVLFGSVAVAAIVAVVLVHKELALVAFDESYARVLGLPVAALDLLLLGLVVAVVVAGLQAVGVVLVVAILIIPAVAARLWSDRAGRFVLLAALFGGASGWLGAAISSLAPRQPAGAVIVLVSAAFFGISLVVAPRGVLPAIVGRVRVRVRIAGEHIAKGLLEGPRSGSEIARRIGQGELATELLCRLLRRKGWLAEHGSLWSLTEVGRHAGERIARNHRLWSTYLIRYAAIAPDHVDPSAERIEHVLGSDLVAELERALDGSVAP